MAGIGLEKVVVHRLLKEQYKSVASVDTADDLLDPDHEPTRLLVEKILERVNTQGNRTVYGVFEKRETDSFGDTMTGFVLGDVSSDDAFKALSLDAMDRLMRSSREKPASTGGHILFASYRNVNGTHFVAAVMVKQRWGFRIEDLTPEQVRELDVDRLAHIAIINVGKLHQYATAWSEEKRQSETYVAFINRKSEGAYFTTALGCAPGATSKQATQAVIRQTLGFFRKNKPLTKNLDKFREDLFDYLDKKRKAKPPESANLMDIEQIVLRHVPTGDEGSIAQAEELIKDLNDAHGVSAEFKVHRSELNKSRNHVLETPDWKLDFRKAAAGQKNSSVVLDMAKRTVTLKGVSSEDLAELDAILKEEFPSQSED